MELCGKNVSPERRWLLHIVACGLVALRALGADAGIIAFQGEVLSETAQGLVGHWRMTKIVFESPRDEHLAARKQRLLA